MNTQKDSNDHNVKAEATYLPEAYIMDRPLSPKLIRRQKYITWSKTIGVLSIIVLFGYIIHWLLSPSVDRSSLRTAKVSVNDFAVTINAGGLVVPFEEETLTSKISSQVVKVYAQAGQRVALGDRIMQLDTQKISLEIDNILEKMALKDSLIKTQQINTIKSINELNSQLELLAVDLESRKTKKAKLDRLSEVGAFSSQDLLEAELDVKRTTIEIRQLNQAISDLKSSNLAQIESLQLEKNILQKSLNEQQRLKTAATINSTRAGVVAWLHQETGSSVNAGQALAKIVDDSRYRVEATLSDFYASDLRPNMEAEIRYQDTLIRGTLLNQTPTIENGIMKISILLDDEAHNLLKNNLRVDVGLVTTYVEQSLTLVKGAYISGSGIHDVFVLKGGIAHRTQIEIGHSSNTLHEIKQGLQEFDEVIISDMSDYLHLSQFNIN